MSPHAAQTCRLHCPTSYHGYSYRCRYINRCSWWSQDNTRKFLAWCLLYPAGNFNKATGVLIGKCFCHSDNYLDDAHKQHTHQHTHTHGYNAKVNTYRHMHTLYRLVVGSICWLPIADLSIADCSMSHCICLCVFLMADTSSNNKSDNNSSSSSANNNNNTRAFHTDAAHTSARALEKHTNTSAAHAQAG